MKRDLRRSAGIILAAGLSATTVLACAPSRAMPKPPSYASFSAQGNAESASSRTGDQRSARPLADDDADGQATRPIYARTDAKGDVHISNVDDDSPKPNATGSKLYRWRDADGREHISDEQPPQGATLLGSVP